VTLGEKRGTKTGLVSTLLDIVANEEFLTTDIGTLGSYSGIDRVCHSQRHVACNFVTTTTNVSAVVSDESCFDCFIGRNGYADYSCQDTQLSAFSMLLTARSCSMSSFLNTASLRVVVTDWGE